MSTESILDTPEGRGIFRAGRKAIPWHEPYSVTGEIQHGRSRNGKWRIAEFTVGEENMLGQMSEAFHTGRYTPPGTYTWLKRGGTTVMSDTPDELADLYPVRHFLHKGAATWIVNGLGLGCVIKGLLASEQVTSIDVVEIDVELAEFMTEVAPWVCDRRVTIHIGDALEYKWPVGKTWDAAWHDIWDTLNVDDLSGSRATLNRRYGRRVQWQDAWGQDFLKWQRDQDRRNNWW